MSIVIFGDLFSFPEGQAATNRVYTYAKGFKENGINVHVVCFSSLYLEKPDGVVDGIPYYHPFQQKKRSNSFIVRRWHNLLKYRRTYKLLKKINKEDKILMINSWTNVLLTQMLGWLYCKLLGTKLVTECSEHPLRYYQGGKGNRISGRIKFYFESRFCDGILCISRYLVELHKKHGVKEKKLFLVPSTVDPSRFIVTGTKPIDHSYIGYFGSLTYKRDNVDLLIKGFARFSSSYPDVRLVLGGFCSDSQKQDMQNLMKELNISDKAQIVQYLSRQEILRYITHADVLVMTRSRDLESDASYPSKLTEFLATGKPVVSANVGEISEYIKDNEDAFLVQPDDVEGLANKLNLIFKDYGAAKKVGEEGKKLTDTVFHYNFQARRIIDYAKSL